jgi:hypothetical protein
MVQIKLNASPRCPERANVGAHTPKAEARSVFAQIICSIASLFAAGIQGIEKQVTPTNVIRHGHG